MKTFQAIVLCILLSIVTNALAQEIPNFSGTWELDTSRGENLGMVRAVTQTVVITQTTDSLIVDVTSSFMFQENIRRLIYDLNGGTTANETAMGEKSDTVSSWVDGTLVAVWTSEGAVAGSEVVRLEKRSLSADARTMTLSTARGDKAPRVMVFSRQE